VVSNSESAAAAEAPIPRAAGSALPPLTSLRFFAAFYVVMGHSMSWLEVRFRFPLLVKTFLGNGYLAVCLFFLLSGFILSYTYGAHSSTPLERKKFWAARFARIYPVYLLSLLLILPFEYHNISWPKAISVLLMIQAWNPLHPEIIGVWNYPAWSLSVEAFFYLCFPFIQRRLWQSSSRNLLLVGAFASLISILFQTPIQGLGLWDPGITGRWLPLPILRIPEFLLGMILGNIFVRFGPINRDNAFSTLAVFSSILLLSAPTGRWVSLVILTFALLIYSLASSEGGIFSFLSNPLMFLLGGASYSIYLLQLPVRDWVRTLGSGHVLSRLQAPLTPFVLILFSILVFRVWEEPARKAVRGWLVRKAQNCES
jgi:peptidoglycan/LPS O-acetylase OafA/YrhL